jgi:hypothetical protein
MIYLKCVVGGFVSVVLAAIALLLVMAALRMYAPALEIVQGFSDPMAPVIVVAPLAFGIGFQWTANRVS